jgi:ABC-type uncharacterized transport system permease subunit
VRFSMCMKLLIMLFITNLFTQYCIAQRVDSIKPMPTKVSARAIPNPITNKLNIQVNNFAVGSVLIQIVSQTGSVVYNEKRLVVLPKDMITIFLQIKTGNYYCTVTQEDKKAKFGFIVTK